MSQTQILPNCLVREEQIDSTESTGFILVSDRFYEIRKGSTKIGRDPRTCSIVIDDKSVSKLHCIIETDGKNESFIYDIGSTNSTKLGKVLLKPHCRYKLEHRSKVTLGIVVLQFFVLDFQSKNLLQSQIQYVDGNISNFENILELPTQISTIYSMNREHCITGLPSASNATHNKIYLIDEVKNLNNNKCNSTLETHKLKPGNITNDPESPVISRENPSSLKNEFNNVFSHESNNECISPKKEYQFTETNKYNILKNNSRKVLLMNSSQREVITLGDKTTFYNSTPTPFLRLQNSALFNIDTQHGSYISGIDEKVKSIKSSQACERCDDYKINKKDSYNSHNNSAETTVTNSLLKTNYEIQFTHSQTSDSLVQLCNSGHTDSKIYNENDINPKEDLQNVSMEQNMNEGDTHDIHKLIKKPLKFIKTEEIYATLDLISHERGENNLNISLTKKFSSAVTESLKKNSLISEEEMIENQPVSVYKAVRQLENSKKFLSDLNKIAESTDDEIYDSSNSSDSESSSSFIFEIQNKVHENYNETKKYDTIFYSTPHTDFKSKVSSSCADKKKAPQAFNSIVNEVYHKNEYHSENELSDSSSTMSIEMPENKVLEETLRKMKEKADKEINI